MEEKLYTEKEVKEHIENAMELGMQVRQYQLLGRFNDPRYDGKSGKEILEEYWQLAKK